MIPQKHGSIPAEITSLAGVPFSPVRCHFSWCSLRHTPVYTLPYTPLYTPLSLHSSLHCTLQSTLRSTLDTLHFTLYTLLSSLPFSLLYNLLLPKLYSTLLYSTLLYSTLLYLLSTLQSPLSTLCFTLLFFFCYSCILLLVPLLSASAFTSTSTTALVKTFTSLAVYRFTISPT